MTQEALSKDVLLDNQLSIWDHSNLIDNLVDEKMSAFQQQMDQTRKTMLDQLKGDKQDVVFSGNTYTNVSHNVETSQITVNGITLRQKVIQFIKERDGVRIPYLIKELFCSPPATLPLVLDYATITESISGADQKILT